MRLSDPMQPIRLRLLAQRHDALAQRGEAPLEPFVAGALELQLVLEFLHAGGEARVLLSELVRIHRWVCESDGHHATSGLCWADGAGGSAASVRGTKNSRRGRGSRTVPQRGHSSRDEWAAALKVASRHDGQCVYGILFLWTR